MLNSALYFVVLGFGNHHISRADDWLRVNMFIIDWQSVLQNKYLSIISNFTGRLCPL
jgi:hypothetical protein